MTFKLPSLRLAGALTCALCLTLAACSPPEMPGEKPSASSSAETSNSASAEASEHAAADPHSLTGLSEVADIGDPTPIGTPTPALPAKVTDAKDRSVEVKDASRILALDLTGTLSRTVIALGLGENIVGRTVSSTEAMLADKPVVTQHGHSINAEAVLSLNPSVILTDASVGPPEVLAQLESAGITIVYTPTDHGIEATGTTIKAVAAALGVPEAGEKLAARTDKEVKAAQETIASWVPSTPLDSAFLYVRGTGGVFFILGEDEGAKGLIEALGARDVASANGITQTKPANAESLITLNPEVIFVMKDGLESTGGVEGLAARAGVAQTRAGANQRIVAIPDGMSLSFGPQSGEILLNIARALYGVS